jgi:hypothetical protein
LLNYTFSKSIDVTSDFLSTSLSDQNNGRLDRGESAYSRPHVLSLSWVWVAPALERWGWIGRKVAGGWELNGIMTGRSGVPFTITSGVDSNLDTFGSDRPDLVGSPILPGGRSRAKQIEEFFNTKAFAAAVGLNGTAGRNIVRGPAAFNWDISAFKEFQIHESHRVQFRTDFFNVFNEVNLGTPNSTRSSPSFGRITAARDARMLQFGLKYRF